MLTEQFSTSLAFFGAQNLIGWAAEITGQLLCTYLCQIKGYIVTCEK